MDISSFHQAVTSLSLFPSDILEAALAMSETLDDPARDRLLASLQAIHEELTVLEDERARELAAAMEEIQQFEQNQLKPAEALAESDEREWQISAAEHRLQSFPISHGTR